MTLPDKYTKPAVVFHWLIGALIIVNVVMIWVITYFPDSWDRPIINLHKSIGLTVLGLAAMRILWRVTHAPPPPPPGQHKWEITASHLAHFALYVLIVGLPLTGYMHDSAFKGAAEHPLTVFGLFEVPRIGWIASLGQPDKEHVHDIFYGWHASFALALYVMFSLHVLGALKHQWFDKQRELQRMTL
ncbi:cytochrome b/b6 domain-containing protein [Polymorphobacter sp. PAMC 29334]|uniref:cytochrome b n=1 Tax=Polymorphobacter sp. PAMC 29334 TaxID=2862331 RepID=UPI001C78D631|nr:cytochrome b/b6 domain-containing protein [Polymorphobacter sp. PAMC 29334]QYE35336.1 cytochrome b/b6 domain-containing protein [Polymorphobacter sp. PAMC 29334]